MMFIFSVTGAGAKGKFCGGFDITAFGGMQGAKSMCIAICLSSLPAEHVFTKNYCCSQFHNQNLVLHR